MIEAALAQAYTLDQVGNDRAGAVSTLRQAMATPEGRAAAEAEHRRLKEVVEARSQGGLCGCHVSKIHSDLLSLAFEDTP
jgi:hypothetical protein